MRGCDPYGEWYPQVRCGRYIQSQWSCRGVENELKEDGRPLVPRSVPVLRGAWTFLYPLLLALEGREKGGKGDTNAGDAQDARNQGAAVESYLKKFISRSEYLGQPLSEGCR